MKKTAGIVISIGIVMALIGELNPIMTAFYGAAAGNRALQIEIITNDPTGWFTANAMMVVGGFIAALGLWRFAGDVELFSEKQNVRRAAYVGAGLALLGASVHVFMRFVYDIFPSPEQAVSGSAPSWMFPAYSLTTRLAIFIIAYILFQTGYSKKLGVTMIAFSILFITLMGIHGPPGVYNFPFLIMGLTLLFKSSPSD